MNQATYSPEDNKLRLYVGRVPRDEYLALKAQGWTALHKQRETGGGDFAATWTPERLATALTYADIIEDEDMGPEERAADRAERFSGYRDKRTDEATGHADRYEAGPQAHGFQSEARAEKAAARHDRIGDRACDAWSKAEYWQRRTAGVIRHALYVSSPSVRMGRIKVIEADLRRFQSLIEHNCASERDLLWHQHLTLRLAYENQMIEAQGGRLAAVEIEVGGLLGGRLIMKVNKSSATGRVTSVDVKGPQVQGWAYRAHNVPGTDYAVYSIDTERLAPGAYQPPTDESRAELAKLKAEKKANTPKKDTIPLVNPTDEDAERLQAIWNEHARQSMEDRKARNGYATEHVPSKVLRITQATYSAHSKGTYASAGTRGLFRGGVMQELYYGAAEKMRAKHGREACLVRQTSGGNYQAHRVIVLTDKPQKPLPAAVWEQVTETVNA